MSRITDVYNAIEARLVAVLPNHKRLPHPDLLELNTPQTLRQGYGILIGQGVNSVRETGCRVSIQRDFIVSITRESFQSDFVADKRETAEKTVYEDLKLVIEDVETDPKIGTSNVLIGAKYLSDAGTELVLIDKLSFIKVEAIIQVEYFEDITL